MQALWSDSYKYAMWAEIERLVLASQAAAGVIPAEWAAQAAVRPAPSPQQVADAERTHHHEMVGFLMAWGLPHVHIGVTSSDIIDLEQTTRMSLSSALLASLAAALASTLDTKASQWAGSPGVARTHGQAAEQCDAAHLLVEHSCQLTRARARFDAATCSLLEHAKLRGPTGNYAPPALTPQIERGVLDRLGMAPAPSATQLAPRDLVLAWAESCAALARACHRIALQIRLDSQTGINDVLLTQRGQGSSSMPHKNNPVEAEQVCGLAGLVATLANGLQPVTLTWGHRDLSNSSVERVTLPLLATLTEAVLTSTMSALGRVTPNHASGAPDSNRHMMSAQLQGVPYFEARSWPHTETPPAPPVGWLPALLAQNKER